MRFRKLRIAWSVAWGVVAVLMCVLWVQSYSQPQMKFLQLTTNQSLRFSSDGGVAEVVYFDDAVKGFIPLSIPFWILVPLASIVAAIPWARRPFHSRYSLQTFLIATTLVAVGLGAIVWAMK